MGPEEDVGSPRYKQLGETMETVHRQPFPRGVSLRQFLSIHKLCSWIAENLRQDLSHAKLASRARIAQRNFANIFPRVMGVTPTEFVAEARIKEARCLLEDTDKGLEEVAFLTGYTDARSMSRAFSRRLGLTPKSYRDQRPGRCCGQATVFRENADMYSAVAGVQILESLNQVEPDVENRRRR